MPIITGVGRSHGIDAYEVGVLAAQEALSRLAGAPTGLVLLFASVAHDQQKVFAGVRAVVGPVPLVGCSTAGEITSAGPGEEASVVVMAVHGGSTASFAVGKAEGLMQGSEKAVGSTLAKSVLLAMNKKPLSGFFLFIDGLAGNAVDTLRGVSAVIGEEIPVLGGAAGDEFHFKETYQYYGDAVYTRAAVGVGISGDVHLGFGVRHGWGTIGVPLKATRSEGNVLYELDGKPAVAIYEKYFGITLDQLAGVGIAEVAVTYPLGFAVPGRDELLIRDPISCDERGALFCTAEIPQGVDVRLMIGSKDAALVAATKAAEDAKLMLDGKTPRGLIVVDSMARKKLFGADGGEEIRAIQTVLGRDVPLVGFYAYGEIAPPGGQGEDGPGRQSIFHNETVVVIALA